MKEKQIEAGYFPQMPICDEEGVSEIVSELSLPDYQPEIRRIVDARARALPSGEYVGSGSVELRGELAFNVLYVGADGALYSAVLGDVYSFGAELKFSVESAGRDDLTVVHFCECGGVSVRALGPRRLTFRTRLSHRVLALAPAYYAPTPQGIGASSELERRLCTVITSCVGGCSSDIITLAEHIPTDSGTDALRLIDSRAEGLISECTALGDGIAVRGELMLTVLYCNDEESDRPLTLSRRIPLKAEIPYTCPAGSAEYSALVRVYEIRLGTDGDGISVEADVAVDVAVQQSVPVSYACDAYSVGARSEVGMRNISVMSPVLCTNGNLTQNESVANSELGIPTDAQFTDVSARVSVDSAELVGERLAVNGSCTYHVVYFSDGEWGVCDCNIPFRYLCDCRDAVSDGELRYFISSEAISPRARTDGERTIFDCELAFALFVQSYSDIELADTVAVGEPIERAVGEAVLYYPSSEESLWDVGKRYGVPEAEVRAQNSISEGEDIGGRRFLII